jgi:hypothetical protein
LKSSKIFIGHIVRGQKSLQSVTFCSYDSLRTQNPNFFWFRFFDMNNNPDNFSKEGVHLGIGEINDGLQYHTLSMGPITSDEIEYYLDKALVKSDVSHNLKLQGSGYIKIKQRIYWKWPKCIWNGEKYIFPGDSSYLSYCNPVYYEQANICFNDIN